MAEQPEPKQYTYEELLANMKDPVNKREMVRQHLVQDYIERVKNDPFLSTGKKEELIEMVCKPNNP